MKKKLLYLGYVVSENESKTLSGVSVAGNKMQLNLLKGLKTKADISIVTIYPVAPYPRDRQTVYKRKIQVLMDGLEYVRVGFINFPVIKQVCQMVMVFREIVNFIKKYPGGVILSYNIYPQLGIPLLLIKLLYKKKIYTLLADLPLDERVNRNFISKIGKIIYDKLTCVCIRNIDFVIVLNKYVIKQYNMKIPFLVMEGAVNQKEINTNSRNSNEKNIVYTGALTEYSGILLAIQAMEYIDDSNIKLDIYGSGELEDIIKNCASKNSNIRFHGKKQNKEILKIQKEAWILINPRVVNNAISKVTFPSKVLEYMLSGRPVLATRLNGFTEEYEDKIIWIEKENPEYLAELIKNLLLYEDKLNLIGKMAQQFVIKEKNWDVQCERIWKFVKNNYNI